MKYPVTIDDLYLEARLYRVECWEPPVENTEKKTWGKHWNFGVVCRSAVEAVEVVREKHPRCRIDAVNQCGVVHHIAVPAPSEPVL